MTSVQRWMKGGESSSRSRSTFLVRNPASERQFQKIQERTRAVVTMAENA